MQLNADQEDVIRELINIGIGRAAATLSELIGTRIELSVPRVALVLLDDAPEDLFRMPDDPILAIIQDFRGDILGRSALVLSHSSGLRLAQLLGEVAEPADELDLEMSGILAEVGNIMLNSVLGAIANMIGTHMEYSLPQFCGARPLGVLLSQWAKDHRALLMADAEFLVRQYSIHGIDPGRDEDRRTPGYPGCGLRDLGLTPGSRIDADDDEGVRGRTKLGSTARYSANGGVRHHGRPDDRTLEPDPGRLDRLASRGGDRLEPGRVCT